MKFEFSVSLSTFNKFKFLINSPNMSDVDPLSYIYPQIVVSLNQKSTEKVVLSRPPSPKLSRGQ